MLYANINLNLVNAFITNLAIIVASILSYYFVVINLATNKKRTDINMISINPLLSAKLSTKILIGIIFGFIAFIVSLNHIPLLKTSSLIDMRYVFIYLTVIYGSNFLGFVTTTTSVVLKAISYLLTGVSIHSFDFFNNIALSFILLILVIILKKYNAFKIHISFVFLIYFFLVRYLFFFFNFASFLELATQIEFLIYTIVFSFIFLTATFIIELSIDLTLSVHIYRTAAIFDSLTGVYNKDSFDFFLDYVVSLATNKPRPMSISVIDIDNFKEINDQYGHPTGDQLLKYFGKHLNQHSLEAKHYICRIGGDEFAIVHNQKPKEAEKYFQQLFADIKREPFSYKNQEIPLSLSVGMTHFIVEDSFDTKKAIHQADVALYQAKKAGKNRLVITQGA